MTGDLKSVVIRESHYNIGLTGLEIKRQDLDSFINADYYEIIKKTKKGKKKIDAKRLVKNIAFCSDGNIDLKIINGEGPELKPVQIVSEIFGIDTDDIAKIRITKVNQITG